MAEPEIINAIKSAVGHSLAGPAGEVCMRTKCQDFVPRQLSSACKKAGRGRHARQLCRPLLAACQNNQQAQASCSESCASYYTGESAERCALECMRAHCKSVPQYEQCVKTQTIRDVLQCLETGQGRALAESCLQRRCGLSSKSDPVIMPSS